MASRWIFPSSSFSHLAMGLRISLGKADQSSKALMATHWMDKSLSSSQAATALSTLSGKADSLSKHATTKHRMSLSLCSNIKTPSSSIFGGIAACSETATRIAFFISSDPSWKATSKACSGNSVSLAKLTLSLNSYSNSNHLDRLRSSSVRCGNSFSLGTSLRQCITSCWWAGP